MQYSDPQVIKDKGVNLWCLHKLERKVRRTCFDSSITGRSTGRAHVSCPRSRQSRLSRRWWCQGSQCWLQKLHRPDSQQAPKKTWKRKCLRSSLREDTSWFTWFLAPCPPPWWDTGLRSRQPGEVFHIRWPMSMACQYWPWRRRSLLVQTQTPLPSFRSPQHSALGWRPMQRAKTCEGLPLYFPFSRSSRKTLPHSSEAFDQAGPARSSASLHASAPSGGFAPASASSY